MFSCCTRVQIAPPLPPGTPPGDGAPPQALLDHLTQRLSRDDAVGREVIERLRAELARASAIVPRKHSNLGDESVREFAVDSIPAAPTARTARTRKFSNSKSAHHMQVLRDAAVKGRAPKGGGLWGVVVRLTKNRAGEGGGDGGAAPGGEPDAVAMDEVTQAWVQSELDPRKAHYDRDQPRINLLAETSHEPSLGSLPRVASVQVTALGGLPAGDGSFHAGSGSFADLRRSGTGLLAPGDMATSAGAAAATVPQASLANCSLNGEDLLALTVPLRASSSMSQFPQSQPLARVGSLSLGGLTATTSLGGDLPPPSAHGVPPLVEAAVASSGSPPQLLPPAEAVELSSDDRPIGQLPWEAYQRQSGVAGPLRSIRSQAMVHAASMHRVNSTVRDICGGTSGLPSSRNTSGGSVGPAARVASIGSPPLYVHQLDAASRASATSGGAQSRTEKQRRRSSLTQPRPIRTTFVPHGTTTPLGSPVFVNSAAIMSPTALASGGSTPASQRSLAGGRRRSSVGGGGGQTFELPPARYADNSASAESEGSLKPVTPVPGGKPHQPGDVSVVVTTEASAVAVAAAVISSSAGPRSPDSAATAPAPSTTACAAFSSPASTAAPTSAASAAPAIVEEAPAVAAAIGSMMYYVNPNAIGALHSPTEGGSLSGGKSERAGMPVEDDESYVKSRISVVKRLRNFAVAGMQLFQHNDHIGPGSAASGRMLGASGKSRRAASQGGPAEAAAALTTRKHWAAAGQKAAMVAVLNRKASIDSAQATKDIAVIERLRLVTRWDFDVFEFSSNTESRPLAYISYELFVRFKLFELLHVQEQVFTAFINRIEQNYCFDTSKPNAYHTSLHAADVVQAVGHFLTVPRLSHILDGVDAYSVLVSAIIHDFRHPGVSNNFLVKTSHPIALRYNDESVLENFHAAEAFAVMANERHDISASLTPQQKSISRFTIIKTVLATDLAQGGKVVNAFKAKAHLLSMGDSDEDKLLVMQLMIKCADVSHPARSLSVHERWSNLITEEFYLQGDLEREKGMTISPLCDRTSHNLAKSQIGFIDFVVRPSFSILSTFCNTEEWMGILKENLRHWKEAAALGVTFALPSAPVPAAAALPPPPANTIPEPAAPAAAAGADPPTSSGAASAHESSFLPSSHSGSLGGTASSIDRERMRLNLPQQAPGTPAALEPSVQAPPPSQQQQNEPVEAPGAAGLPPLHATPAARLVEVGTRPASGSVEKRSQLRGRPSVSASTLASMSVASPLGSAVASGGEFGEVTRIILQSPDSPAAPDASSAAAATGGGPQARRGSTTSANGASARLAGSARRSSSSTSSPTHKPMPYHLPPLQSCDAAPLLLDASSSQTMSALPGAIPTFRRAQDV